MAQSTSEERRALPREADSNALALAPRPRTRRLHHALARGALLITAACGTAAHRGAPESAASASASTQRADQLALRDPDGMRRASSRELGKLEPTAPVALSDVRASAPPRAAAAQVAPIRLADHPKPRPYPLREGALVLASGLVVHRVPKGISVRAAREKQSGDVVFEIADRRGRRLALLKERSFRRAAAATTPVLEETSSLRREEQRSDWGAMPVRVIVDRFRAEHHIYTLERRASGTAWIWSNLELTSHTPPRARAD